MNNGNRKFKRQENFGESGTHFLNRHRFKKMLKSSLHDQTDV